MSLVIDNQILQSAHISENSLRTEVAILLYQQERLTLGQSARMCEISQYQFLHLIAGRNIGIHYDVDDFEQDIETLKEMGRL
jgi:predicted HTH domain antitoxin